MTRTPTIGLSDIRPDRIYRIETLVALFGITERTAKLWCRTGRVKTLPRPTGTGPHRILGSEILVAAGGMAAVAVPTETRTERQARANRDLDEIKKLAKGY